MIEPVYEEKLPPEEALSRSLRAQMDRQFGADSKLVWETWEAALCGHTAQQRLALIAVRLYEESINIHDRMRFPRE